MKKIAIVGTHGVGKTTLCKALAEYAKAQGKKVESVGEVVRDCPYPIHREMTYKAFEWTAMSQILREREAERTNPNLIVCDRSAFDTYIYMRYFIDSNKISVNEQELFCTIHSYLRHYLFTYDYIVLVEPTTKSIENDGFRDTNLKIQKAISATFALTFTSENRIYSLAGIKNADKIVESHSIFYNPSIIAKEIYECLY